MKISSNIRIYMTLAFHTFEDTSVRNKTWIQVYIDLVRFYGFCQFSCVFVTLYVQNIFLEDRWTWCLSWHGQQLLGIIYSLYLIYPKQLKTSSFQQKNHLVKSKMVEKWKGWSDICYQICFLKLHILTQCRYTDNLQKPWWNKNTCMFIWLHL